MKREQSSAPQIQPLEKRIDSLDWSRLNDELLESGFVITKPFLNITECHDLKALYDDDDLFRSTIDMKRYNFGKGSYRYFKHPLPPMIQTFREELYEKVVKTANTWSERLRYGVEYPMKFSAFQKMMQKNGQTRSTPLILRYGKDDFNCLHQDISSGLIFPYQAVLGLTEQGKDYEGGQLILTQQRPRMQTVPHVMTIPKGAAAIFTSNFHPQQGARGFYRTVFKHGVAKIKSGNRYTLGLVFHNYKEK